MYSLNHPYIIKLVNHFEDDSNFYLILELAEGGSLFNYSSKRRGLDEPTVAQYLREVSLAVNYLHCKQPPIIHRDIKPENILLDEKLRAKLCDFGWSNFFTEEIRQTMCGTPEYLAPEMIRKAGHDTRLDLWNLGVLLYELLAGVAPFKGRNKDELYATILRNKIEFPKSFPLSAKDLVKRLLKSNPEERISIPELLNHPWMRSHAPIRPTCELSLTKEDLPIEDEGEIPYERPAAPFKDHEYSVISSQSTLVKQVSNEELTISAKASAKAAELEEKRKKLAELESAVSELQKLTALKADSISLITHAMPNDTEASSKEILTYESTIESLSRSIGSQSRRLKEYEGHIARRQLQVSETKLRLEDIRVDTSRNICQRRELYRIVFAYRKLLAEPSSTIQFQNALSSTQIAVKLAASERAQSISEQRESLSQQHHLKQEIQKPLYLGVQIGALQTQIKAKMQDLAEFERCRLAYEIEKQGRELLS
mmetsp:Transcript_10748/g.21003  ORF Transcript_10748/g.21003 Transcript_10748/m.21003 type:complete len:483 (+) Transcript_10748:135-1583(+)